MIKSWVGFGLWLLFTGIMLNGCGRKDFPICDTALFSWESKAVEKQNRLFQMMEKQKIGVLYQNFSKGLEQEALKTFFEGADESQIDVYFLTGDPQWALQENADSLCAEIERAVGINRILRRGELKGILIDVEPYLLEQWKEGEAKKVMDSYVKCMRSAYCKSNDNNLEVILCIPYFFDSKGFADELETLIRFCCDKVAVMNYYRGKEIKHIETEAALAKKYNRELITIYELQPPGSHGLTKKNTYYKKGLKSVTENFAQLRSAYPDQKVFMALHDLEALKEALSDE